MMNKNNIVMTRKQSDSAHTCHG